MAINPSWVERITSLGVEEVDLGQQDKEDEESCLEAGSNPNNPNNQYPGMHGHHMSIRAILFIMRLCVSIFACTLNVMTISFR